jgi:glyoxylase-like metal-dependent hydrolase (beta-lactamase superfamily II)
MKLHCIDGYVQTILLAEYPDKLMLLDGCSRADVDNILQFITQNLSRPITDLKLIVVTHMHPDHAGAAHTLRDRTGSKIATANVEGQWYEGFRGMAMHFVDILLTHWVASRLNKKKRRLWYSRKLKADFKLDHEQCLPFFPEWRALNCKGHTDRDISLQHMPSNRIYVADLIVAVKGRFISPYPIFYPECYKKSVQDIASLKPNSVILAHGGEVQLSDREFEAVINHAPNTPKTYLRSLKKALLKRTCFK